MNPKYKGDGRDTLRSRTFGTMLTGVVLGILVTIIPAFEPYREQLYPLLALLITGVMLRFGGEDWINAFRGWPDILPAPGGGAGGLVIPPVRAEPVVPPEPEPTTIADFDGPLILGKSITRDGRAIAVPEGVTYVAALGNPEGKHGVHPDVHYIPDTGFRFAISDRAGAFGYALPFVVQAGEIVDIEVEYHAAINPKPDTPPLNEWLWFTGRIGNDTLAAKPVKLGDGVAWWEIMPPQAVSEIVVQLKVHQANAGDGSYVDWKTLTVKKKTA